MQVICVTAMSCFATKGQFRPDTSQHIADQLGILECTALQDLNLFKSCYPGKLLSMWPPPPVDSPVSTDGKNWT